MNKLQSWLETELFTLGDYTLYAHALVASLAILAATLILSGYISRTLARKAKERSGMQASQFYTFSRLFSYTIIVLGLILSLSALGLSFDKLALLAGALGVGIGFGLQNIVNNFVSGIMILFEKSLRLGDFVELESGLLGEVREIRIRSTRIRTLDNADILVPNSEFINGRVNNWTLSDDIRRFTVPFGVAYGSDPAQVIQVVREKVKDMPETYSAKGREPAVLMTEFGDSSLNFVLSVWVRGEAVKRPGLITSDYLLAIHQALKENAIEIPFPQRDLHIRSGLEKLINE